MSRREALEMAKSQGFPDNDPCFNRPFDTGGDYVGDWERLVDMVKWAETILREKPTAQKKAAP